MQFKIFIVLLLVISILGCSKGNQDQYAFTVYTHDSFTAKHGMGPEIFPAFEKLCQCKVRVQSVGDAAQLLSRLSLDEQQGKKNAQVIVGLDEHLFKKAQIFSHHLQRSFDALMDESDVQKLIKKDFRSASKSPHSKNPPPS